MYITIPWSWLKEGDWFSWQTQLKTCTLCLCGSPQTLPSLDACFFFSKNVKTQISKYNCKLLIIAIMQCSIFIYIWWSSTVHYLANSEWFPFPSTVLSDFELYIRWSNTSQRIQGFLKTNDLEMSFLVSLYWFYFIGEH